MQIRFSAHCDDGVSNEDLFYELDDDLQGISNDRLAKLIAEHYHESYHNDWDNGEGVSFQIYNRKEHLGDFLIVMNSKPQYQVF